VGLMQIMPDTGGWIAEKLGEDAYDEAWLTRPETNIRYGCWYLRYLLNRYDEHLGKALAAYNAGGTNVDKWIKNPEIQPDPQVFSIERIPFAETKNYVQKVQHAYAQYQCIYPDLAAD